MHNRDNSIRSCAETQFRSLCLRDADVGAPGMDERRKALQLHLALGSHSSGNASGGSCPVFHTF